MENKKNKLYIGIILFAICLYVSYPLYNDYLIWQHDLYFHLSRLENIKSAFEVFQFPVRIHPLDNFGYGYGVSMVYPELFMYIPALFRILDYSIVFSYKVLLFFINYISIISIYLCVKNISKSKTAGIIGAIIYAGANYRLEDLFTRGAIGESLALAFLPIAIWGLYELCVGDKKKWYIFIIGVSFVIQSHIISVLFAFIVCTVVGICFIKNIIKEKRFYYFILCISMIILLNLWFIIPFIDTYNLGLNVSSSDFYTDSFKNNTVMPTQLFNIFDTAGNYNTINNMFKKSYNLEDGILNDMNFSLGLLCNVGLIICIAYCIRNWKDKKNINKLIKALTGLSIICLILTTNIVNWEEIFKKFDLIREICDKIQFSWRLLRYTNSMYLNCL